MSATPDDPTGEALRRHPFLAGLDPADVDRLVPCATLRSRPAGERLAAEGDPADTFHLVVEGRVGIEVHVPRRGALVIATVEPGEVVGWSWKFPPHTWAFDAVALSDVTEIGLDAEALAAVLADHPALDAEITRRLGAVVASRLRAARTQLLDVYGPPT